jgi:hypothetical protein
MRAVSGRTYALSSWTSTASGLYLDFAGASQKIGDCALFLEGVKGAWTACDPLTPSRKILVKKLEDAPTPPRF